MINTSLCFGLIGKILKIVCFSDLKYRSNELIFLIDSNFNIMNLILTLKKQIRIGMNVFRRN
jgi:hypothetical protein